MGVDSASGQHRLEQGTELVQFFPIQNPIPILDFGYMVALQHPAIFQLGYDDMGDLYWPIARHAVWRDGGGAMRGIRYFF